MLILAQSVKLGASDFIHCDIGKDFEFFNSFSEPPHTFSFLVSIPPLEDLKWMIALMYLQCTYDCYRSNINCLGGKENTLKHHISLSGRIQQSTNIIMHSHYLLTTACKSCKSSINYYSWVRGNSDKVMHSDLCYPALS